MRIWWACMRHACKDSVSTERASIPVHSAAAQLSDMAACVRHAGAYRVSSSECDMAAANIGEPNAEVGRTDWRADRSEMLERVKRTSGKRVFGC